MNTNTHFVIGIRDKIPYKISGPDYIVTDNSDYTLELVPDAQWEGMEAKTILYAYDNGTSVLRPIIGNADEIPMIQTTGNLHIGVTAGEMKTSTWVSIPIKPSIRKKAGTQIPPPAPGVYDQIIGLINEMIAQADGRYPVDLSLRTIISVGQPDKYVLVLKLESGEELTEPLPQMGLLPDDVVKFGSGKPSGGLSGGSSNYKQFYIDEDTSQLYIRTNKGNPGEYLAVGGFLAGNGAPSTTTVASKGNIYLNITTAELHRCTGVVHYPGLSGSINVTWEKIAKIPTKTSELENDAGFITKSVSDLANYYRKEEINALVSRIPKFSILVVDALPTSGISATTIYLVKSGSGGDLYTEYIYTGGAWEILGSQKVDLTGYATEAWVEDYVTAEKIVELLGYTPAKEEDVSKLSEAIADLDEAKADGIIESATGEVIAVSDSAKSPLRGLTIYGKSTQGGTPTPDAPVPIVSVGSDGVMDVGVYGANLLNSDTEHWENGTLMASNGKPSAGGKRARTPYIYLSAGTYKVSTQGDIVPGTTHGYKDATPESWVKAIKTNANKANAVQFTVETPCYVRIVFLPRNDSDFDAFVKEDILVYEPMLKLICFADDYEPYTAQTLPISTPDGLCGIPVTSGGNYTDANGQQWVCDEVDFVRGVRVKRINTLKSDGSEKLNEYTTTGGLKRYRIMRGVPNSEGYIGIFSHGKGTTTSNTASGSASQVTSSGEWYVVIDAYQTADAIKQFATEQYMAGTPLTIAYILATPIETPLTESELAAYKALYTNHPNTTIYADDNAGLAVQYKADTKAYIDKKFDALAAAVLSNA